ncbi:MAG: glycosyltransferase family 2 protein [Deltaproteobacteria bacterium]|nr:glycosyltransferase family 2 protein [Deltaproteobacteria bacterium]
MQYESRVRAPLGFNARSVSAHRAAVFRSVRLLALPRPPQPRFDRAFALVIPAYNEAKHISDVIDRCARTSPTWIVVIDDASTDSTRETLEAVALRHRNLVVLTNDRNLGKQGSVRRGLSWLRDKALCGVAVVDGDGQLDPAQLPAMASLLSRFDVIIGARTRSQMPIHRQISNAMVNLGFLFISGVDFFDVQSGLRVYSKALSDLLAETLTIKGGYALEHVSLSIVARHAHITGRTIRVAAVPATCTYEGAESKMKPSDVVSLACHTVRHAWRIRCATKPGTCASRTSTSTSTSTSTGTGAGAGTRTRVAGEIQ